MTVTIRMAAALVALGAALSPPVLAQSVKVTPLGGFDGEFCAGDRALVFEDPNGTRLLYDPGRSVVGAGDAFLAQWLASVLDSSASTEEALRAAVATGAASVLDVGAGRFDPAEARRLAAAVELRELQPVS